MQFLAATVLVASVLQSHAQFQSTFDASSENWMVAEYPDNGPFGAPVQTDSPVWVNAGGNPGGFITFQDVTSDTFYFQAPASWGGNRLAAYGQALSFDLMPMSGVDYDNGVDVILSGAGIQLVCDAGAEPISGQWNSYSVVLSEDPGWRVGTAAGPQPTAAQFQSVLSDLQTLAIRGEFRNGLGDVTGLDNVQLQVPEPGTASLLAAGLSAVLLRRKASKHRFKGF
jgi:Laminin B (Domain IV)/PEP-CTERM motif